MTVHTTQTSSATCTREKTRSAARVKCATDEVSKGLEFKPWPHRSHPTCPSETLPSTQLKDNTKLKKRKHLPLEDHAAQKASVKKDLDSSGNDLFTSWVKMSDHEILVQHVVDIEKATAEFREASERKHATSSHMNSSSERFATVRLCRKDSASTTGTLGPGAEKKMPSKNRLQWGGISLPCRRRPNMLTTSFSRIASTWLIMQALRFSSIRTLSIPTSMSNLSTFMTQDETCQIKSWKENRDGSCKVFFHVPYFGVRQYHSRENDYSFDALQTYCFGINIKL